MVANILKILEYYLKKKSKLNGILWNNILNIILVILY